MSDSATLALIQARMGSTRLPGKMMLPLGGDYVITRVVERVKAAETVDDVVVATSTRTADDILARYAEAAGAEVFRGSESDVLARMYHAAESFDHPHIIIRVTGDCPLIDPIVLDEIVRRVNGDVDYASNVIERTFPRGLDAEAFTFDSFSTVNEIATEPYQREHVTSVYHESPELFTTCNVVSDEVYPDPICQNRTDLRFTLDEADDYELIKSIYDCVPESRLYDMPEIINTVDSKDLSEINAGVNQKAHTQYEDRD